MTRAHVRLLGPCFKTGRMKDLPKHHRLLAPTRRGPEQEQPAQRELQAVHAAKAAANRPCEPKGRAPPNPTPRQPDARSYNTRARGRELPSPCRRLTPLSVVVKARGKCANPPQLDATASREISTAARPRQEWLNPPRQFRLHPFASKRFHVLLNSLFKVLFNFPSRYLSAIGLVPVFSLRWSLPPVLSCIPKQLDSKDNSRRRTASLLRALHPLWARATIRWTWSEPNRRGASVLNTTFPSDQSRRIRCWALPPSLAVTRGIPVGFFSSA